MNGVAAIEARGLTKDFSFGLRGVNIRAVDQLSLRIEVGQIFGLLGPNGSGKSTTIKMALGLLESTQGSCRIFGVPSCEVRARCQVGYLPESPHFHRFLSGRELVAFYGRLCGLRGEELRRRVDEVIAGVGLEAAAGRRVGTYSRGMLQRIGVAQAIVHDPRLVILDEPMAGIDPVGVAEITALIQQLKARGKTIVLVAHELTQVEALCDRIAILDRGRLVVERDLGAEFTALEVSQLSAEYVAELQAWLEARGGVLTTRRVVRSRLEEFFSPRIPVTRETPSP